MRIAKAFAIAGLLAAITLPGAALEPKKSSCEALAAWAANLETLPTDYASFTSLPVSHRRAVYQRLSAAERAGLWHEQWQQALRLPGWNAEQRALMIETSQVLGSSASAAAKRGDAARSLEAKVAAAFPQADARRLFYLLGPSDTMIEASAIKICNCTVGGSTNFCEVGDCQSAACLQPIDSCGFSWEFPCDGLCR